MNYWMVTPDLKNNILISLYQVGYEKHIPESKFGPYTREFYLLHYIKDGKGTFITKNKIYDLNPGDIFLIRPGEETTYYANTKSPYECYWIGFNGPKCNELIELLGFFKDVDVVSHGYDEKLINCFEGMYYPTKEVTIKYYLNLYNHMYELFSLLCINDGYYKNKYESKNIMERIEAYIEENYMEKITVVDIASSLNLSRSQTFRLFKKIYGISPSEYLSNFRVNKSINLVLQTNLSMKEIAYMCGFSNVHHFIKSYRRRVVFSPMENRTIYIENLKNKEKDV